MKKVCLVTMGNIFSAPYIHKYINAQHDGIEIEVIYWNVANVKEHIDGVRLFPYQYQRKTNAGKIVRVLEYLKFRKFLKKNLLKNNYDGIIFLQTISSILVNKFLTRKYKNNFIIDVRDYTFEKNLIFKKILGSTIKKSYGVVISSQGYKNFLPKYNYIVAHNTPENFEKQIIYSKNRNYSNKDKIIISYIGIIRFKDQIYKFIERFKNDDRFMLKFIGKGANDLKKYCEENQVDNVQLIDYFHPSETIDFYNETDLIYNLYGNNTPLLDYALSNKLYYASMLNKPILVCPNTYMEEISHQYKFGITVDLEDTNCNTVLYNEYKAIDFQKMKINTKLFNRKVIKDNLLYNDFIKQFYMNLIEK